MFRFSNCLWHSFWLSVSFQDSVWTQVKSSWAHCWQRELRPDSDVSHNVVLSDSSVHSRNRRKQKSVLIVLWWCNTKYKSDYLLQKSVFIPANGKRSSGLKRSVLCCLLSVWHWNTGLLLDTVSPIWSIAVSLSWPNWIPFGKEKKRCVRLLERRRKRTGKKKLKLKERSTFSFLLYGSFGTWSVLCCLRYALSREKH